LVKVYLNCIPREQALNQWFQAWQLNGGPLPLGSETLPVDQALGRVLAEPVFARFSVPHYAGSAMDGIAVQSALTQGASPTNPLFLAEGSQCIPLDTGDLLPPGYDSIIMIEDTHRVSEGYEIIAASFPGQHLRPVGEDITAGRLLLTPGQVLESSSLAAALACGNLTVKVVRRPRVALIPSGDEIVAPTAHTPQPGCIPEFNSLLIKGLLQRAGAEVEVLSICPDRPEIIKASLQDALETRDFCIVNAGSSAGRDDYAARVIEELGQLVVHGVAIRPGAPVVLGIAQQKPVLGIPGYPVSAALVTQLFALPVISQLTGLAQEEEHSIQAVLSRRLASPEGREEFIRVQVVHINGRWIAVPGSRGSGNLHSLAMADGLLVIPLGCAGLEEGIEVTVSLRRPIHQLANGILLKGILSPALDQLALALAAMGWRLIQVKEGSRSSLKSLMTGETHLAAFSQEETPHDPGLAVLPVGDANLWFKNTEPREPWLKAVLRVAQKKEGHHD
jgi:molybdenum cofactor synthesis domain-containing protein